MPTRSSPAIRHLPTGYYPDDRLNCDRVPPWPVAGEFVIVKAEVRTDLADGGAVLQYTCNGRRTEVAGRKVTDYHGGKTELSPVPGAGSGPVEYSLFELGRFAAGDRVEYLILAGEGDRRETCGPFGFTVCDRFSAGSVAKIHPVEERAIVEFEPVGPYRPVLEFAFVDGRLHVAHSLDGSLALACASARAITDYKLADPRTGIQVELCGDPFSFTVTDREGRRLFGTPVRTGARTPAESGYLGWRGTPAGEAHSFELNLDSAASHYFGFGERFDALDQNGRSLDVCVINQYTHQGSRTYLPVPFFLTELGYGLHVQSDRYVRFRLAPRLPGTLSLTARLSPATPRLDLVFFFGEPKSIVGTFALFSGPPALPPKWAFGPWMSGNSWNTQREVEEHLATTTRLGIPATVLVIEAWSDEATFYIFNEATYRTIPGGEAFKFTDFSFASDGKWPDPQGMIDRLRARDMHLILWQIPVLKYFAKPENRQHQLDEAYAIAQGYCVRNADGTPYRIPDGWFAGSLLLDFTNPAAREWWFAKRRYLIDELGVDGFKTDGGEFILDESVRFYDGSWGDTMRNRYPLTYIRAYNEFMGRGRITFSRSGFTGGHEFPLYWAGDQVSTYDEFRAVLTAGLSLNLSGNAFWGFDIGGFSGDVPTADLFIRAAQMAAFSPVMQYHSETRGAENYDRTPWNIAARTGDERVVPIYRDYANTRMNLLPYIYNEAMHVAATGEPMIRALFVDFPDDPESYKIDDEYLFGRDLLVAPVLAEHARERRLYLPAGEWLDLWTLDRVQGGWHERYPSDLEIIPVFLRQGAILPLNLGDGFVFGLPTGARGTAYSHLCFLVPGKPDKGWEFSDDEGNRVRFTPVDEGLRVRLVEGSLSELYLLSPVEDPEWEGYACRTTWGKRGPRLWVCRVSADRLRGNTGVTVRL
ncbi:MAG: TIM-barrel domain-containing protein [Bacillota bacterium]